MYKNLYLINKIKNSLVFYFIKNDSELLESNQRQFDYLHKYRYSQTLYQLS